ncbi:unnamed protein product [Ascophyllum nodosum]
MRRPSQTFIQHSRNCLGPFHLSHEPVSISSSGASISTRMATFEEPIMIPTGSVGYRSVDRSYDDLSSIGDSTSGEGSEHLGRKLQLIVGKAWRRSVDWQKARKSGKPATRLVDRKGAFHQSFGRWNIRRLRDLPETKKLVQSDPFHSMVNNSTSKIIFGMLALYISIVFIYSLVYLTIYHCLGCHLELPTLREAFLFSLETMSTVGYGTSDYLFDNCLIMLPVLTTQACMGLLIDAFLIGILFVRLSRPQTRASTVVFTKNAIIRRVRGESYFMFQIGELRKHQLLEVRVRCYALRHERLAPTTSNPKAKPNGGGGGDGSALDHGAERQQQVCFQCHHMRLQHPDDELGGNLLLVLPQTVVHRIDAWSPMMPPPRWNSNHGLVQWGLHSDREMAKMPWEECEEDNDDSSAVSGLAAASAAAAGSRWAATAKTVLAAARLTSRTLRQEDRSRGGRGEGKRLARGSPLSRSPGHVESTGVGKRHGCVQSWRPGDCILLRGAFPRYFSAHTRGRGVEGGATDRVGYVHRFPDLLKRWDDVDGDRGTWYEVMKRRMVRVEAERRREEARRAERAAAESSSAAAKYNRPKSRRRRLERRPSIMKIENAGPPPLPAEDLEGGKRGSKRTEKLFGKIPEDFAARASDLEEQKHADAPLPSVSPESAPPALGRIPSVGRTSSATLSAAQWFAREERKAIDAFLQDRELEVVVILEGTDTATGSTVQARYSYCWEDIQWNRTFASCVTQAEDGACLLDFSKFHDTVRAPEDCFDPGFVQSYA